MKTQFKSSSLKSEILLVKALLPTVCLIVVVCLLSFSINFVPSCSCLNQIQTNNKMLEAQSRILAPSARGKYNLETFRDMALKAINSLDQRKSKADFKAISDFLDQQFKIRENFILRHTLNRLEKLHLIKRSGNNYKVLKLLYSGQIGRNGKAKKLKKENGKTGGKKTKRKTKSVKRKIKRVKAKKKGERKRVKRISKRRKVKRTGSKRKTIKRKANKRISRK